MFTGTISSDLTDIGQRLAVLGLTSTGGLLFGHHFFSDLLTASDLSKDGLPEKVNNI